MTPVTPIMRFTAAQIHCLLLAVQPNNTSPEAVEGRRIEAMILRRKQDLENRGFRVDGLKIVTDEPFTPDP